ncbi:hypothetical protein H4P12_05445 [Paracoccus sp. 11-3]|uniref:Lysozyme inhibitor LprI N-terminal domain-containing protein n=2 Tax=Paracoccus amoyensis TaxID=2760093 RepID=A0A926GD73_9RHOB|nr:hypothetical protein [Paracoccus amoyensis]
MPKSKLLIAILLIGSPMMSQAASFDCDLPDLKPDERAICDNRDLNDADVKMVTTLDLLAGLFAMGTRGNMMDQQVTWLHQREACGADVDCIRDAYDRRQKQLDDIYQSIDRPI